MKSLKFFLFILVFSLFIPISGFSQGVMSGNGLFVASVFKKSSQSEIYVHKFMTKELVRILDVKFCSVDEVQFSYSGNYLYAKQGNNYAIINVMLNKSIVTIYSANQVVFPRGKDYFLVLKNGVVSQYDFLTGKTIQTYNPPSDYKIFELVMSPDNNYFAAKAVGRIYIYELSTLKYKKEFAGSDIKFQSNGKYLTVLYAQNETARITTYKISTFYQERAYMSEVLFKVDPPGGKFFQNRSSLSFDGQYVGLYTAKGVKVEIYVFDTWTGKLAWVINNFSNTTNELYPQEWTASNTMIGHGTQLMAGEYSLNTKSSKGLGLRIANFTQSPQLSEANQQKNRQISNDFHYVVVQSGSDMYIRDSRIPNKKITYQGVEFISFSEDSKYIFVKKGGAVNVIVAAHITKGIQENSTAKLFEFGKTLSVAADETMIPKDATPPKGFAFFYVNNTKQIVQVDTSKLHYTFRSMNLNGNDVELQVNLVDAEGNTFLGATDPNWKYIWCNLLLQNPSGSVNQINDFVVEEVFEDATTAYALILDHSGSMGTKRANDLQFGAWELVNNKRSQDAYMLIKYDDDVKVEAQLTKEKSFLSRKLNNTGITGYGGATALVDATYIGVKKLQKADGYEKKVIILLTEARAGKIEINVIGFGDDVNEEYLRSLAYNTGGMYVHLYDTKDLRMVFRDIDYKRKHYYKVKFKTQVKGKHLAFLQLCQDQFKHDSIWMPFDNSVDKQRIDERNPVLPIKPREIKLTQFNKLKIPINPVLKPVTNKKVNKEFGEIHFPNILFATGSDKIVRSDAAGIDELVKFMLKYPYVFVEVHGHTDNQGTPEFNLELSKKRAEAAKKLIVSKGIAPGRVVIRWFGDTKPMASNDTEEGKKKNRRIEFLVFIQ
jgi:outer membrane protein OmpA-like peptidoglycan-associated protein